ncbi:Lsg locus protein 1 [Pasteurellaceae bacterium RH1A]|nr:Lsg locus protein 1 [Pasteurellaceae bacterium RH1A]
MKAVKDSLIYLVGELTAKMFPFLLLPYLSRKLGVEGFGELSYYQTYLMLFAIVLGLSQDGAIARYFYFYGKRSLNLVLTTGYAYTLTVGSLFLAACLFFKSEIMAYVTLNALVQALLNVQLSVRQCQKQALAYMVIQLVLAIVSALITVAMLEFFQTDLVEKRLLAMLFGSLFTFVLAYLLYRQKTRLKAFSFKQYKIALFYILGFGLPLVLHQASHFLKGQLDRIFIFHQFSQADLGLYAMGAQIAFVLMVAIQAINKATLPHFYEALKKGKISIKEVHKWMWASFLLVPLPALIMWLIPESLVTWILGSQFVGTKYYIILFLLSTMLVVPYLILVNYLFYYGKNKLISLCSVLSTIIYVVSLMLLTLTQIQYIPFAGMIGSLSLIPILYFMTAKVSKSL